MEYIVAWLSVLSLAVVFLLFIVVKLIAKVSQVYTENLKNRARLNMLSDKGDPIRRPIRPFIKDSSKVEFALKELTDDDSFENMIQ